MSTQISLMDQSQRGVADVNTRNEGALREAAKQFEALFLRQLTAALGPSGDEEEGENLFGNDAGTNLSRQMFSEQMATVMSEAGGIGLAESLLRQFQLAKSKGAPSAKSEKTQAFEAVRAIRDIKQKSNAQIETETKVENNARLQTNEKLPYYSVTAENAYKAKEIEKNESVKSVPSDVTKTTLQKANDEIYIVSEADSKDIAASVAFEQSAATNPYLKSFYPKSSNRPSEIVNSVSEVKAFEKLPKARGTTVIKETQHTVIDDAVEQNQSSRVDLHWPIRGRISSNFGHRHDPFNGKHKFHAGLDIAAPRGTPIGASADGVVVFAGWGSRSGNYVVIEHADGRRTKYAHADELLVSEGEEVKTGQTIATVGSSGRATGPHLHFEIIENERAVNPIKALSKDFQLARR